MQFSKPPEIPLTPTIPTVETKTLEDSLLTNVLLLPNVSKVRWRRFWHAWTCIGEDPILSMLQHCQKHQLAAIVCRGSDVKHKKRWKMYGQPLDSRYPSAHSIGSTANSSTTLKPVVVTSPSPPVISPADTTSPYASPYVHSPPNPGVTTPGVVTTPGNFALTPGNVGLTPGLVSTPLDHNFLPSHPDPPSPEKYIISLLTESQIDKPMDLRLDMLLEKEPKDYVREVWVFSISSIPNPFTSISHPELSRFSVEELEQGEFDIGEQGHVANLFAQAFTSLAFHHLAPKLGAVKLDNRLALISAKANGFDGNIVHNIRLDWLHGVTGLFLRPTIHSTFSDGVRLRRLHEADLFDETIQVVLAPWGCLGQLDPSDQSLLHASLSHAPSLNMDNDEDSGDTLVLHEWAQVYSLPPVKDWWPLQGEQRWKFKTVIVRPMSSSLESRVRIPLCCVFVPTTESGSGSLDSPVVPTMASLAKSLIRDEITDLLAPARALGEYQTFLFAQNGWKEALDQVDPALENIYKDLDQELPQRLEEVPQIITHQLEPLREEVNSPIESDKGDPVFGLLEALESHKDLDPRPRRDSIIRFGRTDEDDLKLIAVQDEDWDWFGPQPTVTTAPPEPTQETPPDIVIVPEEPMESVVATPSPMEDVLEMVPVVVLENDPWAALSIPKELQIKGKYDHVYEPRHRESSVHVCDWPPHHERSPIEVPSSPEIQPLVPTIHSSAIFFLNHPKEDFFDVSLDSLMQSLDNPVMQTAVDMLLAAAGFTQLDLTREIYMSQFMFGHTRLQAVDMNLNVVSGKTPWTNNALQTSLELKWMFGLKQCLDNVLRDDLRGPLTIHQFLESEQAKGKLQLSIKKKIKGKETTPFSQLAPPHLVIGRGDSLIGLSANFWPFWNKLGVKPRCGTKDIRYFCLYPCGLAQSWTQVKGMTHSLTSKPLSELCKSWLADVSSEYQLRHLGTHAPLDIKTVSGLVAITVVPDEGALGLFDPYSKIVEAYKNGLERLASVFASTPYTFFDHGLGSKTKNNRFLVIYMVDPLVKTGEDAFAFSSYAELACKLWWDLTRLFTAYFLQPVSRASGLPMDVVATRCVLHLIPPGSLFETNTASTAFAIYNKCRLPMWRNKSFASMWAPSMTLTSDVCNPTAAMGVLAPHFYFRNGKRTIGMPKPLTEVAFNVLEPDRLVHVVYDFQETGQAGVVDWGTVCIHDAMGDLMTVFVVESDVMAEVAAGLDLRERRIRRRRDLMVKVFERTMSHLGHGGGLKWRLVFGKMGEMTSQEVLDWKEVLRRLVDNLGGIEGKTEFDKTMDCINSVSFVTFNQSSDLQVFQGPKRLEVIDETEVSCTLVGAPMRTNLLEQTSWATGWLLRIPQPSILTTEGGMSMFERAISIGSPLYSAQVDLWWHVNRFVEPVSTNFPQWGKPEDGQLSIGFANAIVRDLLRNYHGLCYLDPWNGVMGGGNVASSQWQGEACRQVGLSMSGQWNDYRLPLPFKLVVRMTKSLRCGGIY